MQERITKISQVAPEVTWFLRSLGFTNYYIIKLYDLVGDAAVALTEDNPYWILEEFPHFGFKRADELAARLGKDPSDPQRIEAAVRFVLSAYAGEGHSYAVFSEFSYKVAEFLSVSSELVRDVTEDMTYEGKLQLTALDGEKVVYFYPYFKAECDTARMLAELSSDERLPGVAGNPEAVIRKCEESQGIILSREQRQAVNFAIGSGVSIITGGPGTGKTTVLRSIISIFENAGMKVKVACPTGRAAKRVMEATGHYASTVHRLLEAYYDDMTSSMRFGRWREEPLDCQAVIIDEASMLDILLTRALLDAVKPGTRVVFVGDSDQLPSVGAGNVLGDMIESEFFSTTNLTEIYRQETDSMTVLNAHRINRGEYPEFVEATAAELIRRLDEAGPEELRQELGDFILIREREQQSILERILELEACPGLGSAQVLTPVKKGILGSINLNVKLQEVFNPGRENAPELRFGEKIFRLGDRVMQVKNDYRLETRAFAEKQEKDTFVNASRGVFNGEIGEITAVDPENKALTVCFDGERWADYGYTELEELEHAYGITVHKSQGSEFPGVILPISWFPDKLAVRSLLYTAITRGKRMVICVGDPKYARGMVDNDRSNQRNSGLAKRLKALYSR